jgi:hypothetical protein
VTSPVVEQPAPRPMPVFEQPEPLGEGVVETA